MHVIFLECFSVVLFFNIMLGSRMISEADFSWPEFSVMLIYMSVLSFLVLNGKIVQTSDNI